MWQLLDLCMLDISSLDFSYSVLAAAAFCHFSSFDVIHKVSGELIDFLFTHDMFEKVKRCKSDRLT